MTIAEGAGRSAALLAAFVLFVVIATLNSAGYRYGASDQAFYGPAVIHRVHPELYPRDAPLIAAQADLTLVDETLAPIVRVTGVSMPALFAALYIVSLALLMSAGISIGTTLYRSRWTTVALVTALTLRHAIAESGTNTLEGYFHPRQLAFGFAVWGVAFFLRGRGIASIVAVAAAAALHPTTALWFAIWLGTAAIVENRRLLLPAAIAGGAAAVAGAWALTTGPLAGRLDIMDAEWLATLGEKRYLFPLAWPIQIWLLNLAYPVLIVWLCRRRAAAELGRAGEAGLTAGALALLIVFLATLPFNAAHRQLAIQLQPARIFWLLDLLATVYTIWACAEGTGRILAAQRPRLVAGALMLFAIARGIYIAEIEFPGRPMFAIGITDTDWGRAMRWARESSSPSSHWLADPDHALLYGTSVRVAGERDVFVEAAKDEAVGMYSRPVAMRTRDRVAEIGNFHALTPERARALAALYGLDYLVTEDTLDLPVAFASGRLRVYRLR